jgi:flavin-dependent dehydrogenase
VRLGARETDLLVVGGGPAGCAAAMAARTAAPGLRVTILDAARFPRDKLCGGAIPGGGLRELAAAGLALRVPRAEVRRAVLRLEGRTLDVALPSAAAVVERRAFDHDLVRQARDAGVEVVEGAPLVALAGGIADTGAGLVACRAVVVADGVSGAGRRAVGLPPGRRVPLREATAPARAQDALVFDLDAGVAGYAWRFPCPTAGGPGENLGAYALAPEDPGPALRAWAQREGLPADGARPWALRLYDPAAPAGIPGALLAGDALGADPLAGEGIRYALWSGRIAGRLAAGALRVGRAPDPGAYRRALARTRTGAVLALSARLGPRLHGGGRWRRLAADRAVAEAWAALVSGAPVVPVAAALLARYAWLRVAAR